MTNCKDGFAFMNPCNSVHFKFMPFLLFTYFVSVFLAEIGKVRGNLFQINGKKADPLVLPDASGPPVTLSEKVYVPIKDYPDVSTRSICPTKKGAHFIKHRDSPVEKISMTPWRLILCPNSSPKTSICTSLKCLVCFFFLHTCNCEHLL